MNIKKVKKKNKTKHMNNEIMWFVSLIELYIFILLFSSLSQFSNQKVKKKVIFGQVKLH